jgi:hypothetical protein
MHRRIAPVDRARLDLRNNIPDGLQPGFQRCIAVRHDRHPAVLLDLHHTQEATSMTALTSVTVCLCPLGAVS